MHLWSEQNYVFVITIKGSSENIHCVISVIWSDNGTQILSGKIKEYILLSYQGVSGTVGKILLENNIKKSKFEAFHKYEFCHQECFNGLLLKVLFYYHTF